MRNVAKLVALDMGALYSGTHKYRWWSYLVAFLIVLIAFLNGDAATPLAGAITGTSVGILMMPFASVDRHGLEQLYTMLPIRRREIVASLYLFGLLVMLMIDLYAAFIVAVGMIARFNPIHDYHAIIWMLFFATGLVLLQMTLSFPLMIGLGFQRAPLAAYLPIGIVLLAVFIEAGLDLDLAVLRPWLTAFSILLIVAFAFSWWLSTYLYKRREF